MLLILSFFALALSCSTDGQCNSVSYNPAYVKCDQGQCKCLIDQGFTGDATSQNKCGCPHPKQVFTWRNSDDKKRDNNNRTPYCVVLADAVTYDQQQSRNQILVDQAKKLYNKLIWPEPYLIIYDFLQGNTTVGTDVFAPNAKGRFDHMGVFNTFGGTVEYFFGAVWTGTIRVVNVVYKKVLVQGNQVFVRADLWFNTFSSSFSDTVLTAYNVTQSAVLTFNNDNLVESIEAINHNQGKASDGPVTPQKIGEACYLILNIAKCNSTYDPEGYYTDMADCLSFMSAIPYGSWGDLRYNSTTCRVYHAMLSIIEPAVHCPHAGKTGGHKCYDFPLEDYYKVDY